MSELTLTEFLLARIAEDEAVALAANSPRKWRGPESMGALEGDDSVMVDPARVLADVAAKRRIVESDAAPYPDGHTPPTRTLRILAAVYADHPAFNEAWRV